MKVLIAHNFYQQPGGEDQSFRAEAALLESRGHAVTRWTRHNDDVARMGKLAVARATLWNSATYREVRALCKQERFDVLHCQNTFPLISPAIYYAAKAEGVPVVQSLRNYRLLCPNGLFFRDGKVCEDCLGKTVPLPALKHNCYRGSKSATAVVAALLVTHRTLPTWTKKVDLFVALTEFCKKKFVQAGLPADKIVVKPNFIPEDPGVGDGSGGYAVFVGRLSEEKGLLTTLKAWETLGSRLPLKILGDGPLLEKVQEQGKRQGNVECLGRKSVAEMYEIVGKAAVLIFPSEWYETFGRVAIEAFAKGTPVIASNLGAMAELIDPGRTGLLFEPGNAADLAAKVEQLLADKNQLAAMRDEVRREFEAKYTAAKNYDYMLAMYEKARSRAGKHGVGT